MKKKFIIGGLISLVFLYLAFRKVDYYELWSALKGASYWYILPNVALVILSMWMRAYRWKFMVDPIKKLGLAPLFSSVMIGFMANNVLPARLGEFVRAYSLGTKENISRSATFATIVIERIFDGFSLLFILWLSLLLSPFPDWVKKASNLFLLMNIATLAFLVLIEVKRDLTLKFFNFIFRILPASLSSRAGEILEKFIGGLKVFRDVPSLIWILAWSIFIWIIVGISNYFIFLAFGLQPPIQASFILLVIVSLGVMLPSSPGFVGTFQFFCVVSLATFGYDKNVALPFSIVLHASQYFPVTLLGLYYLKREHLSLKGIEADSISKE
ncbi:MAG: flippase-like domain-containing protein [candidate division Zixibacteria bacterium]|nr:flippase-like domain-containing protein [candidate division Zixibacteria bacterium]